MTIVYLIGQSKIEVICHEVEYYENYQYKNLKIILWLPLKKLETIRWNFTPKILFHTNQELKKFIKNYHYKKNNFQLLPHNYYFRKKSNLTKVKAKKILSLQEDIIIFLCIGFINQNKGFHRIINSFSKIKHKKAKLFIIGNLRDKSKENYSYLNYLKKISHNDNRVIIYEQYLEDEIFDTWIIASDYVVLPYSQVWSSGVLERAKLYEKPTILSYNGGLPEQADTNSILFNDDNELDEIVISLLSK